MKLFFILDFSKRPDLKPVNLPPVATGCKRQHASNLVLWGLLLLLLAMVMSVHGQSLMWMDYFFGYHQTIANDVSGDGRYVVGFGYNSPGTSVPFLWDTHTGQKIILSGLGNPGGEANAITPDGRFVTGWARYINGLEHAFLWDAQSGQMQDLGTLNGGIGTSEAYDISSDGSIVVGVSNARAFLWDSQTGQMQNLDTVGISSGALGVSPDGQFVVGWIRGFHVSPPRACIYEPGGQIRDLDEGDSLILSSSASKVSNGGYSIVGRADTSSGGTPFTNATVWSSSGTKTFLGNLGGDWNEALDVSADGQYIVGFSKNTNNERHAILWGGLMLDLNAAYDSLLNGSLLIEARAISPDGRYIVGYGNNAATNRIEAFWLDRGVSTGIEQPEFHPKTLHLYQNFPNPFNPTTTIEFSLPHNSPITLHVYDVAGQKVKTLVAGTLPAGNHKVQWDGTDDAGQPVASGIYIYRLQAGSYTATRKMMLIR